MDNKYIGVIGIIAYTHTSQLYDPYNTTATYLTAIQPSVYAKIRTD